MKDTQEYWERLRSRVEQAVDVANAVLGMDFPRCSLITLPDATRKVLGFLSNVGLKDADAWEICLEMALGHAYWLGLEDLATAPPLAPEFIEDVKKKFELHCRLSDFSDALRRVMAASWVLTSVRSRGTYVVVMVMCTRCDKIRTGYPDVQRVDDCLNNIRPSFLLEHSTCKETHEHN